MKKKLFVLILTLGLLIAGEINSSASSDEVFEVTKEKIVSMNETEKVLEVKDGYLFSGNKTIKYLYENSEILKVNEEYFAHAVDLEYLYLVSKNDEGIVLSKINKKNKKREFCWLEIDNPINMTIIDNELVIIGSDRKDALIVKYDKNLNYLQKYSYGGTGYESFNQIYNDGSDYLIIGTKTAHSLNSPFLSVGNADDLKVFMTKINKQGIILDSCYFNHQGSVEELVDSDFHKGMMMVKIRVNSDYHIYTLDSNLSTLDYEKQNFLSSNLSVISNNKKLLTIEESNILKLKVLEKNYDLTKGKLLKVIIDDNVLKVYYYLDHYLCKMDIYQYQILKQEDIVINKLNLEFNEKMDMNTLEEIKIDSFVHQIDLQLDTIEPFFNKQIHGTYNALFKVVINQNKSFLFNNQIKIEEYLNIYDGHTYPVGYNLNFSGYALLDNKSIVSGYKVNEEGLHNLVITDASGNKSKYTFRVANSDYYKNDYSELEFLDTEYIINKNEELRVKITSNKELEDIYVNGEKTKLQIDEQGLYLVLNDFNKSGIYPFKISLEADAKNSKNILVRVLKDVPNVNIKEENSSHFKMILDIKDEDKAIENLKFVVLEKENNLEKIVETQYFDFLKTDIKIGNIQKDKEYILKGYFLYDQGLGEITEQEFLNYCFNNESEEYLVLDMDIGNSFAEIEVNLYTNDPNIKVLNLKVKETELRDKYQVINNYTPIYVSVTLSLVVVGIMFGYYFYHKRKQKK